MPNTGSQTDGKVEEVLRKHESHYLETMEVIPESLALIAQIAPEAFDGYSQFREWILRPDGHLPRKYKHLIFSLLDCSCHNLGGAVNHMRAAMRAGVTADEVKEAMLQLIVTHGVPAWGTMGRHVVAAAIEFERDASGSGGGG